MHECKTVTLRTRPLKKNMLSFYLDYYPGYRDKESMKIIRHESLGIYIYANPKNQREKYYSVTEAMEKYGIRRDDVYNYARYNSIRKMHHGKSMFLLKEDFDKVMAEKSVI